MGSSHDSDILAWSRDQAWLLRQHAAGATAGETPDWPNIIEEVESVGRSQLSAVKRLLVEAMTYDLRCEAWPLAAFVPHARAEARGLRGNAVEAFTPSMRQHIDVAELYRRALQRLPDSCDGQPPLPVPPTCPVTLDELLSEGPDST